MTRVLPAVAALCSACVATGPSGAGPATASVPPSDAALVPPGYGTLRQDEITLTLRRGPLQVKLTPLDEWVLRLTAPDTWNRLSELAAGHRARAAAGSPDPDLWLVSFFAGEEGVGFQPEDVSLVDRGRRFRPDEIRPLTSGWGTQRLDARETQSAVYVFDGALELDMGLVAEYGDLRSTEWDAILQHLQAELARARARAGG